MQQTRANIAGRVGGFAIFLSRTLEERSGAFSDIAISPFAHRPFGVKEKRIPPAAEHSAVFVGLFGHVEG